MKPETLRLLCAPGTHKPLRLLSEGARRAAEARAWGARRPAAASQSGTAFPSSSIPPRSPARMRDTNGSMSGSPGLPRFMRGGRRGSPFAVRAALAGEIVAGLGPSLAQAARQLALSTATISKILRRTGG